MGTGRMDHSKGFGQSSALENLDIDSATATDKARDVLGGAASFVGHDRQTGILMNLRQCIEIIWIGRLLDMIDTALG